LLLSGNCLHIRRGDGSRGSDHPSRQAAEEAVQIKSERKCQSGKISLLQEMKKMPGATNLHDFTSIQE
jgi:hypothetical protein